MSREERERERHLKEAGCGKYGVLHQEPDPEVEKAWREGWVSERKKRAEAVKVLLSGRIGDKLATEVGREWLEMERKRLKR